MRCGLKARGTSFCFTYLCRVISLLFIIITFCVLSVLHTYVFYPWWVVSGARPQVQGKDKQQGKATAWPPVCVLMAAHNEETKACSAPRAAPKEKTAPSKTGADRAARNSRAGRNSAASQQAKGGRGRQNSAEGKGTRSARTSAERPKGKVEQI